MANEHPLNSLQIIPDPPKTISEAGSQEWAALIESIAITEHTRPVDLRSFELLCELLADIRGLETVIRSEGYTVESSGGPKPHPALRSLESARRQAVSLLDRFGILPHGSTVYNRH